MYVKEPPGEYTIEYARWADHTMYLVSHMDEKHGECQYILAHYQVEHCTQPEQSRSAVKTHYQVEDSQCDECSLSPAVEGKETHYQVEDSQRDECSLNPAVEGKEVVLQFGDKHQEVEVSSDSRVDILMLLMCC